MLVLCLRSCVARRWLVQLSGELEELQQLLEHLEQLATLFSNEAIELFKLFHRCRFIIEAEVHASTRYLYWLLPPHFRRGGGSRANTCTSRFDEAIESYRGQLLLAKGDAGT